MQSRGKKPKIESTAGQAPPGRGVKVLFRDRIPRHLPGNSRANRLSLFGRLARGDPRWPAAPLPVCRPPLQQTSWSGTPPRQPNLRHHLRTGQAPEHDFRHRLTIAERQKFQRAAQVFRKFQLYRDQRTIEVCCRGGTAPPLAWCGLTFRRTAAAIVGSVPAGVCAVAGAAEISVGFGV